MACAPSEDSDQPGHPPSLIRVFAVRMKKAWVLSYPFSVQRRLWSDWADAQADLSLRWAHTHFVGFVMSRLKLILQILITLGDHQLYRPDPDEVQVRVSDLHIHPSYTGEANEYGVKEYDIALLDFGQDTTRQPVFNKHIRPICMATNVQSNGNHLHS